MRSLLCRCRKYTKPLLLIGWDASLQVACGCRMPTGVEFSCRLFPALNCVTDDNQQSKGEKHKQC